MISLSSILFLFFIENSGTHRLLIYSPSYKLNFKDGGFKVYIGLVHTIEEMPCSAHGSVTYYYMRVNVDRENQVECFTEMHVIVTES